MPYSRSATAQKKAKQDDVRGAEGFQVLAGTMQQRSSRVIRSYSIHHGNTYCTGDDFENPYWVHIGRQPVGFLADRGSVATFSSDQL